MESILARHRQEQKQLQNQIISLKKQSLKKTRRAANDKCSQLQYDLDEKHKAEINEFNGVKEEEIDPLQLLQLMSLKEEPHPEAKAEPAEPAEGKKRNRAKERLAKRQAEIDRMKAEAEKEAALSVDYRAMEMDSMKKLLAKQGLAVQEVKPDGHCLFALIQDQLATRRNITVSVADLRKQAAEYIRQHRDDFIPFLFDENKGALRDVDEYTEKLENTAMWGSDMEIKALALVYGCPIEVLSSGAAPIVFNPDCPQDKLVLVFYKYNYGLGEHYDSTRVAVAV